MKTISLSRCKVAIVDDEDYEHLSQYSWHVVKERNSHYAVRVTPRISGKRKYIRMHREILGLQVGERGPDHADRDGLNNQKYNLRLATTSQNGANRGPERTNQTGYKGVYPERHHGRDLFRARIQVNKRKIHLGRYTTAEAAALAYNRGAMRYFGEFAWLNSV